MSRLDPTMVAIDGPSGSGKSTVARQLARERGWRYVDTGAMYRAVTWAALEQEVPLEDAEQLRRLAEELELRISVDPDQPAVTVGDADISREIRSAAVTTAVSQVSAHAQVRAVLVARQRRLAAGGRVVMEGRDIGTTVLPGAATKIFLTAAVDRRAARRGAELGEGFSTVVPAIRQRDSYDANRSASPMRPAPDAAILDSSELSVDQVVACAAELVDRAALAIAGSGAVDREGPILWIVRRLAQLLVRFLLRVRLIGEERIPDGPVLLAGNHTGFLDGPLVYILLGRPAVFLAKSELFSGPWARVLRGARQLPIRRGTPDRTTLGEAAEYLEAGGVVGMFPEGTRGEGKLETIQDGVGYLAARTGCPIVPVVCRGTAVALPKGHVLPRWRARVDIVFGEPFVAPKPLPLRRAGIHAASDLIASRLRDLVAEVGLQ